MGVLRTGNDSYVSGARTGVMFFVDEGDIKRAIVGGYPVSGEINPLLVRYARRHGVAACNQAESLHCIAERTRRVATRRSSKDRIPASLNPSMEIQAAEVMRGPPVHVVEPPERGGKSIARPRRPAMIIAIGLLKTEIEAIGRDRRRQLVILAFVTVQHGGSQQLVARFCSGDFLSVAAEVFVVQNMVDLTGVSKMAGKIHSPLDLAWSGTGAAKLRVRGTRQNGLLIRGELIVIDAGAGQVHGRFISNRKTLHRGAVVLHHIFGNGGSSCRIVALQPQAIDHLHA